MTLDAAIQLHEELRVWYTVDGYAADLQTHDGDTVAISCRGQTPEDAIDGVRQVLADVPDLRALRAMQSVENIG